MFKIPKCDFIGEVAGKGTESYFRILNPQLIMIHEYKESASGKFYFNGSNECY